MLLQFWPRVVAVPVPILVLIFGRPSCQFIFPAHCEPPSVCPGNLSSMAKKSISIPRYVIVVAGPSHFSWTTKTPNWSHVFIRQALLCSHSNELAHPQ